MICANLGVDFSREMDSGEGTHLGYPLYFVVGPYNCSTNVLLCYRLVYVDNRSVINLFVATVLDRFNITP